MVLAKISRMNSTTGEFSKITSTKESYVRDIQTCVKKKHQTSRKFLTITPLDLNKLKKQIEEAKYEEPSSTLDKETICRETVLSAKPLEDISNSSILARDECEEKLHRRNTLPAKKDNDSFDLDFSALSLITPVKNFMSENTADVTPKIRTVAMCPNKQVVKFNGFVTPDVKKLPHRNCYSVSKGIRESAKKSLTSNKIDEVDENFVMFSCKTNEATQTSEVNLLDNFPFEKLTVKQTEYIILNTLGKGGSSEVFAGFCPINKRHVAIKCVSLHNPASAEGYINEVKLLQKLQHCDKIIKMYDYEIQESEKKMLVVLEKGGEDLATILKNQRTQSSHMPIYMLMFYWMEMLYAVKQIHSNGVIHSDLKPANFLRDISGLKLIDFGISSSVQIDMTSVIKTTPEGSCNYISPEALNQENSSNLSSSPVAKYKIHFKSDVWSLGCILYQLVYRKTPFQHLHNLWKKLAYITNPAHVIEFPDAKWVPQKVIETLKKCLIYNVKLRPSVDELIQEYEDFFANNYR